MKKSGVSFQEKEANALNEQEIEFVLARQGERVRKLKKRAERCVCKYCGEKLSLRKITYAAYDEAKTEPIIYKMAEYYADEIKFDYYPQLDESVIKRRMNVALISEIIAWGFKNAGLLDDDGFTVDLMVNPEIIGEVSIFAAEELDSEEGE